MMCDCFPFHLSSWRLRAHEFQSTLSATDLGENGLVLDDVLIGGEQNVEAGGLELGRQSAAHGRRPFVWDLDHRGCPLVKLQHPVGQRPGEEKHSPINVTTKHFDSLWLGSATVFPHRN